MNAGAVYGVIDDIVTFDLEFMRVMNLPDLSSESVGHTMIAKTILNDIYAMRGFREADRNEKSDFVFLMPKRHKALVERIEKLRSSLNDIATYRNTSG